MKFILINWMISLLLMILYLFFMKKTFYDKEKISSFECGFDAFSLGRIPFSLRFFKITLIFLIFDIEIILILPLPLSFYSSMKFIFSFIIIMMVIFLGLIYEWNKGTLNWIK